MCSFDNRYSLFVFLRVVNIEIEVYRIKQQLAIEIILMKWSHQFFLELLIKVLIF